MKKFMLALGVILSTLAVSANAAHHKHSSSHSSSHSHECKKAIPLNTQIIANDLQNIFSTIFGVYNINAGLKADANTLTTPALAAALIAGQTNLFTLALQNLTNTDLPLLGNFVTTSITADFTALYAAAIAYDLAERTGGDSTTPYLALQAAAARLAADFSAICHSADYSTQFGNIATLLAQAAQASLGILAGSTTFAGQAAAYDAAIISINLAAEQIAVDLVSCLCS